LKKLHIIISKSRDIYENLAYEEHILNQNGPDYLILYINSDAIVMGKHQNPWLEIDIQAAHENKIKLARRLSGGGTVFHDEGNINFSFIRNKEEDFVNFREHIEPISAALKNLGIDNSITKRNDIFIGDHKISGNAEHIHHSPKKILHHGTLLYDAQLSRLNSSTKPKSLAIETHAVNSVRYKVQNIREAKDLGSTQEFLNLLVAELNALSIDIETIDVAAIPEVQLLVEEKYATWEWQFGKTPRFKWTNADGDVVYFKGGIIESIESKTLSTDDIQKLVGQTYKRSKFEQALKKNNLPTNFIELYSLES
jgi:lipoate-protein ligase A